MTTSTDVAVIGGGPAGLAVALDPALRDRGVTLIEAGRWNGVRLGETLAPTSEALLDALGVADVLEFTAVTCEGTTASWAADELEYQDHWQTTHGPGYFLARPAFDAELVARVVARGHTVMGDTSVTKVHGEPGAWVLDLRTSTGFRTLQARMLVDASGRRAVVARRLGQAPARFDRLVACTARIPAPAACPPRVLVEARPDGWWYASPVPGEELVLAYLTDSDLAHRNGTTGASGLARALADTTHVRVLGSLSPGVRPVVRPAFSALLRAAAGDGWIAVGDAATSFDPLSSTGIHNALRTAASAAEVISGALQGDSSGVEDYARARRTDFGTFLADRADMYGRQARFDGPFWRRRRPVVMSSTASTAGEGSEMLPS